MTTETRNKGFRVRIWHLAIIIAALAMAGLSLTIGHSWGRILFSSLEQRIPRAALDAESHIEGIIALGGDFKRFEVAVEIAKKFSKAKLVFNARGEVEPAVAYALKQGIPYEQLVLEDRSRTTYENAQFSAMLLDPQSKQRWVLVTSASHMPRAVGVFRKAGFNVLAWPVFHPADIQQRYTFDNALHEWLGLVGYRLLGRTDAIFPGPLSERSNDQ